jgi:hypothetical protein
VTQQEVDPIAQLEAEENALAAQEPEGEGAEQEEQDEGELEPRRWAGKFDSPEAMEQGYTSLEQRMGQMGNELGQLRQAMQNGGYEPQAAPQQGYPPAQASQAQDAPLTAEELREWAMEDPVAANQYLFAQMFQQHVAPLFQQQQQLLAPVLQSTNEQQAASAIQQLKDEFGEDAVRRHREALAARIEEDDGYFLDAGTRVQRLKAELGYREWMHQQQAGGGGQRSRRPNGQYAPRAEAPYVEGGSTPQPSPSQPQMDPVLAEMESAAPRRDLFGKRYS